MTYLNESRTIMVHGYFINMKKTCLVVKSEYLQEAKLLFSDLGISITTDAREYLGAAIGDGSFTSSLLNKKVTVWIESVKTSSKITLHVPATHCMLMLDEVIHGLSSQWSFALRTNPAMANISSSAYISIKQMHPLP